MQTKANPHMQEGGGLPEPLAAAITSQLAAGLAHMHGLGVAHRDVKPENVTHTHIQYPDPPVYSPPPFYPFYPTTHPSLPPASSP